MRIGYGEDAHKLAAGKPLVIAGIQVESERGAIAHSDGDVVLHALSDALLSAFALGDIGEYFPDTDSRHKDIDSAEILRHIQQLVTEKQYQINNIAVVVTLDTPKLGIYRIAMKNQLALLLGLDVTKIGLTFKTSEGLAPDHIQARVMVLLQP